MTSVQVQSIIDKIFSYDAFDNDDRAAMVARYNRVPAIAAMKSRIGQSCTPSALSGNTITSIPTQGITISQPGNYSLGQSLTWSAPAAACAAITITCDNVTLDLGGYTLTASVPDNSQQVVGILVQGGTGVTIGNGTLASMCFYGICAENVTDLAIVNVTVDGMSFSNLTLRDACPAGIHVDNGSNLTINGCTVQGMDVTADSSAGIQVLQMNGGGVSGCQVSNLTNHDGSAQGYSYILCYELATANCSADTLVTHFGGNILTTGHTSIGFVPIFCVGLIFEACSANNITGCCDDAHGMSIFLDVLVVVDSFTATNVTDGVTPTNTGAKATGLEVYGALVEVANCTVSNIKAIVPQDLQSAGFSAWGAGINFQSCSATNVTVAGPDGKPDTTYGNGVGYGWAPDPRCMFNAPAVNVSYQNCSATDCQVGFDSWYHIDSIWQDVSYPGCTTGILEGYGGQRTISGNQCSECNPPFAVILTNIASGNTFPPG